MKTRSTKFLAATFIVALASGCASVTDAGIQPEPQPAIERTAPAPTPDHVIGDTETQPIVDKPLD